MYSTYLKYVAFIIIYAIICFILFVCGKGSIALILLLLLFPIAIYMRIKLNLEKERIERENHDNLEEIVRNSRNQESADK